MGRCPPHPRKKNDRTMFDLQYLVLFFFFWSFSHTPTFQLLDKPLSQVSSLLPPRFLPSIFIAHRVLQSHCSSIFHRVLLTHALALSASQFVRKKNSPRIYISMHSAGFELTKLPIPGSRITSYATGATGLGQRPLTAIICCFSHMKSHSQVRGHGTGSSLALEWNNTPGKN